MVKMKGMGELENLSYKEMRGTYFYETFHFEGVFCHESKHKSSTPKFFEILGGMNRGSQPRANHGPLQIGGNGGDVRGVR